MKMMVKYFYDYDKAFKFGKEKDSLGYITTLVATEKGWKVSWI